VNQSRKISMLKAGIIDPELLDEFSRWGVEIPDDCQENDDPAAALEDIREAVEAPETVELRMTDLDALSYYSKHEVYGRLYFERNGETTFTVISYAKTPVGHYLIPWTEEGSSIHSLMLDESTYLKPAGEERVYFMDVSELFYGEKKAFMVCVPVEKKP
jgi:hypothetical protein